MIRLGLFGLARFLLFSTSDVGDTQRRKNMSRLSQLPNLMILALLAVTAPLLAETPSQSTFGEAVEVSEVLLDVLVTDRDGKVVVGLTPDDFVVEEKGQTLPITGASFYSNRIQLPAEKVSKVSRPAANEVPADRHFILFFQDYRRNDSGTFLLRQQIQAGLKAKEWVETEMLPGDWVAVLSYDYKLKVHSDFSRDRQALARAVERASRGLDPTGDWASRRVQAAPGEPSLLSSLPTGNELRDASKRIYDGMSLVAEATSGIAGRKNLLLFTIGFGDITQGRSRPDLRYYPKLKESLNANNVAVYPIDLAPPEARHLQIDFMQQLASDSGGSFHDTFVSFLTPMRRIADENNGYYLLSYQASHPAQERGYRKIEIRAKNPELKVRARQGYRYGI
jgi:VWFA-related protein